MHVVFSPSRPTFRRWRVSSIATVAVAILVLAHAGDAHARRPVGAVFLRVGVGARAAGLADADLVSMEDPSALHWNPAALSRLGRREILLLHNEWLGDVRQEFLGGAFPLGGGGWGVGMDGLYVGNIPRYVEDVPTQEAQSDFGAYDIAVMTGYGRAIGPGLAVGLAAKGVVQKIDYESAASAAADVGLLYATPIEGLDAAVVAANLGPPIEFLGVNADLPAEGRAGIGYRRSIGAARAGLFALWRAPRRLNPRAQVGIEVSLRGVSLRLGRKLGYDVESAAYGIGYEVGRFAFDYAFVPFSEDPLGDAHRVSLSLSP